jgi:hypothetical protein
MTLRQIVSGSLTAAALLSVAVGCGSSSNETASQVQWIPVAGTSRASLEKRDLEDKFLFGFRVVDTKGFFTTALTLDLRPTLVDLKLARESATGPLKLFAVDAGNAFGGSSLMAFDATEKRDGGIEIDFSTETYIELTEGLINPLGGQVTEEAGDARKATWKSASGKKPRVLKISQDNDTLVADVEHTISFTRTNEDGRLESRTGSVVLRVFLARQNKAATRAPVTVGEARKKNFGFFGADAFARNDDAQPIVRYDFGKTRETKIVYLKDFPSDMVETGKNAVTAWNIGFGFEAFRVEVAPANVDIGDPRYNVIKWFNGLEKEVPWAGYAPTMADPVTGAVVSTQILINGSATRQDIEALAAYTAQASQDFKGLKGKIGNVPVVQGAGESPVVTFFTDADQKDPKAFAKGYYYGVIMHEFGHSLGLRHNFAASTKLDADETPSSVMDYEPNFVASKRTAIGSYDLAAIRYGYFNESPRAALPFCTDEDLAKRMDCNQGDIGNPVDYVIASLLSGVGFLENSTLALPAHVEKPMMGSIKNAGKLYSLTKDADERDELFKAVLRVRDAAPASDLTATAKKTALSNLSKLKASFDSVKDSLPSALATLLEN